MTDHKDFMHGAALVAVADSSQFTALNKASVKYGHYVVNHDRHLFIKYSDVSEPPGQYLFTYTPSDKRRITEVRPPAKAFAVLVCGTETISGLSFDELRRLVDLTADSTQSVTVVADPGKSLRFRGSVGRLDRPIARSAFPERILA